MIDATFVEAIQEMAKKADRVQAIAEDARALLVDGKVLDLRYLSDEPERIKQTVSFQDHGSLISYFEQFGEASGKLFGDLNGFGMTAVLDYHGPDSPSWATHTAKYSAVKTTSWQTWEKHNSVLVNQRMFAEFIEENLPDIASPPGAELLELVSRLEGTVETKFTGGVRLDNGATQLQYEEEIQGKVGKNKVMIPNSFTLGLKPFEGAPGYRVEALLRWRIKEGALSFFYKIPRMQDYLREAFAGIIQEVATKTGVPVLIGKPE